MSEVVAAEVVGELPRVEHPAGLVRALNDRVSELVSKAGAAVRHGRAVGDVLEVLAAFVDGRGWCFCAMSTIARKARYSVRHVHRAIIQAEAAGLLVRSVPRVGARLLGTASEYWLPWWCRGPASAVSGALAVLGSKRKGPAAPSVAGPAALSVLAAVERSAPLELARRVAAMVGGSLGFDVMREASRRASLLAGAEAPSGASLHKTPRPNKVISKRLSENSTPVDPAAPSSGSDRAPGAPAVRDAGIAERLAAAGRAMLAGAKPGAAPRVGAAAPRRFSERN